MNNWNKLATCQFFLFPVSCHLVPQSALGPCGTHRGRTWCPLTGQQRSSVMCSIWCHSGRRRRSRRLVWNPLTPSPRPRFFSRLLLRDAADLGASRARRKRTELNQLSLRGAGGPPPQKAALVYLIIFQEVTYFVGWAGRGGVEARLLPISCCWIARRWSRCSEAVGLRASTLQPGTMSPESLKFVLLAALQALSVCDGLVSKPDEGKSWSWGPDFAEASRILISFLRNCALWSFWVHRVKWIIVGCLKYDTCLRLYAVILCMKNKSVFGNHRKDASAFFAAFWKDYFSPSLKSHCWHCLLENSELGRVWAVSHAPATTKRHVLEGKCFRCDVRARRCVKLSLWAVAHDISVTSVHAPGGVQRGSFAQCTRVEVPRGCCCIQTVRTLAVE